MPTWLWIVIVLAGLAVIGVVVWQVQERRRTAALQDRFGPEYERVAGDADDKREAEAELSARAERRDELDIQPLPEESRARYVESWQRVQSRFVDDPRGALDEADALLQSVMRERGYPVEDDFERRADDVSVDHPEVVQRYREGHRLAQADDGDESETENLREAMQHFRALFEELVESAPARTT
jgi:hypothetical protein